MIVEYHYFRADLFHTKGDYDLAIKDYDELIRIDSRDYRAYFYRGKTYSAKSDYDSAIADYNQAICLNSRFADVWYYRGLAYTATGDHDKAMADLIVSIEKYTALIKNEFSNAEHYYHRGLAYEAKGDHDAAIAEYIKAVKIKPDYTEVINIIKKQKGGVEMLGQITGVEI
jgi:tetratricopeptide (TPR) repeat protein